MRTVHWTGIHIQCSMAAAFNARVATPRDSVPSTVRKCEVPTNHLCSEISFSRTSNIPDLILYIYRITSVMLETLHWLCVHGCTIAWAQNKHLLCVQFSNFLRGNTAQMSREPFLEGSRVDFLYTQLYYIWFDRVLDGGRWCNGLLQSIADSRFKKGWKPLFYANLLLQKKTTFNQIWIMLKNT